MDKNKAYARHKQYKATPERQYAYLQGACTSNGIVLSITLEEYKLLRSQPCHYCGHKLPITGYCLDRKDGTIGYTIDNCVPCCTVCNFTKHTVWSYEEYKQIAVVVSRLLDERLLNGVVSTFPHDHITHKE